MATVVDALVVTLGLNASGFTQAQREMLEQLKRMENESNRVAKKLQSDGDNLAQFFSKAKNEALALIGVTASLAGVKDLIWDAALGLTAINRASLASGESTQFIQAFSAAIGRTGGNIETAKQQLIQFAAQVEQFKMRGGNSPLAQYSQVLGIDPLNAKPQQVIEGIMRAIERNPGPSGRQYILNMGAQLGVPNDLMLSLIQIGTLSNLQAAIQRSVELGAVQSQKQIDAAIKFQGAVVEFEQAVTGLVIALIPFEWMAKKISGLTEEMTHPPPPVGREEPGGYRWLREHTPSWLGGGGASSGPTSPGHGTGLPTFWQWLHGEGATPALPGPRATSSGGPLTSAQQAWATAIAGGEASAYNIRYGERSGQGTLDLNGPHPGTDPNGHSAAGRYQFIQSTWMEGIGALGLPNVMSASNQDAVFAYLLRKHGVTDAMLADPAQREAVLQRLRGEWPSLPGGSQQNTTPAQLERRLGGAAAPPLIGAVPYGVTPPSATPVSNSSDLTIHSMNINVPSGDPKHIAATVAQHLAREITNAANAGMA